MVARVFLWHRVGWSLELVQPHSSRLSESGERRWTEATRWQQKLVVLWFVEAFGIRRVFAD